MRLALATCERLAELYPPDRELARALEAQGFTVVPWVWDRPAPEHDAVLVRTIWDYWTKQDQLHAWLDALEESGRPVLNPVPLLRYNLDKRYLFDLHSRGVIIPATAWVEAPRPLSELFDELGADTLVVKPAISAGGDNTFVVDRSTAASCQAAVDALVQGGPILVQEMLHEVWAGEVSLIFFGGEYSHAVRKIGKEGEFRVHIEHGSCVASESPSAERIAQARRYVQALPATPSYARVDVLERGDESVVMELELIEPELFFDFAPGSAARFAAQVATELGA